MKIAAVLYLITVCAGTVLGWDELSNEEIKESVIAQRNSAADGELDTNFHWTSYVDVNSKSLSSIESPIMVLITRSWCQASRALKDKLASSSEVQELAKQFTLLKLDETTDPLVPQWTDGTYTPRVVFVAPHGKGYPQAMPVDNLETGNKDYPHYYWDAEQVYAAMEKALAIHEEDYPNRPLVDVLEPANVRLPYDVPDVHHLVYTRPQEDEHAHDDPTKPHVEGNDGAHRRTQRSAGKKARSEL